MDCEAIDEKKTKHARCEQVKRERILVHCEKESQNGTRTEYLNVQKV